MRLQSESSQGLQLSEDLTGAGESVCNMTYLHRCWQQVSVPCHVDLSIGLHDAFVTCHLLSSMVSEMLYIITQPQKPHSIISEISCWSLRPALSNVGGGYTLYKNVNTKRLGPLRAILEAGCDTLTSALNGSYPSHIQNTLTPPQGSPKSCSVTVSN